MSRRYRYQKSYRMKKRKSVLKSLLFWQAMLVLLCLGGLLYFFFISSVFQVKNINVSGEQKVSREEILSKVDGDLSNHFLFFKTKSIFLANAAAMRQDLMDSFPQLAGVAFARHFPSSIDVKVTERQGVAFWCGSKCFLVDNAGVIFEKVSANPPNLIKLEVAGATSTPKLGEKIVDSATLTSVLDIKSKMEGIGLKVSRASVVSADRANFLTDEGWEAYFNLKGDVDWQITELNLVLEKEISAQERGRLQYIDLRFTRVYYK